MTDSRVFSILPCMRLCHYCWTEQTDLDAHILAEHPGWSKKWGMLGKMRDLTLTGPDGVNHYMSPNDVSTAYRKIRAARKTGALTAPRPAHASVAPEGEPGPAVDGPAPAVSDNTRPMHRIYQMKPPANMVTRGAVEAAFTREFLADMIREGSRVVSEWDGAGVAGTFSAAESAQLALLLYDPTISLIITRFGGRVDRFKLMLAAAIIAGGRGRAHLAAISAKSKARAAKNVTPDEPAEREEMTTHGSAPVPANVMPAPGSDEWYEQLRIRQSRPQ